jgi:hypothetical protein
VLELIERELASETDETRSGLDAAFARFERTQPHLAEAMAKVLASPLDETALALGYFLSIAIWLAFERAFGTRLAVVSKDALGATEAALALEEQLRAEHGEEPLDLDDVVAIEQPAVLSFVNEHVEAALELAASELDEDEADVDVDDVHRVFRAILVLTLSLSHAVQPAEGLPPSHGNVELLA